MAIKRMLIDSSHPEETRVVVATGNRLDEFDFETSTRKQLKGNIYLAKVTRVEPSLQAAFVDFGGNRHGFLPFSEIHPDYYQIPVSDREALFREQEAAEEREEEEEERRARSRRGRGRGRDGGRPVGESDAAGSADRDESRGSDEAGVEGSSEPSESDEWHSAPPAGDEGAPVDEPFSEEHDDEPAESWRGLESAPAPMLSRPPFEVEGSAIDDSGDMESGPPGESVGVGDPYEPAPLSGADERDDDSTPSDLSPAPTRFDESDPPSGQDDSGFAGENGDHAVEGFTGAGSNGANGEAQSAGTQGAGEGGQVEEIGGDEVDDQERRRAHVSRSLLSRRYKIQEVIKKRQIMLIQVVKEERGTKGAALTTYLSLAGRYCVLMPNAIRGGGISRKIVNAEDRRRLKAITSELDLPTRMGVIVRTAGMNRTKAEIKRDFEYLLRQWESIRELTLQSTAPSLIYGEANLIRRSIRDLYAKDIDEILVDGDEGYRIAKDFMRTLIPSHTAKVQPYRDRVPLFVRFQVESQLDSMYSPQVQLKSGGYLVINQTEALVAIDVNSGRATRERNIEETAYRTNMEAAEELARQLRLRDLAGLIVIDFIDMDESRNQRAVERRLKDAMKNDRARIQIGRISPFGLLELSRQRLRPSLAEASMETCPSCGGAGMVRSVESAALHVLRAIEEEGLRGRSAEIRVKLPTKVALYILNNKRTALADIEQRYGFATSFGEDNTMVLPGHEIERLRAKSELSPAPEPRTHEPITAETTELPPIEDETEAPLDAEVEVEAEPEREVRAARSEDARHEATDENGRRRRRRRRRGGSEGIERGDARPSRHVLPVESVEQGEAYQAPVEALAADGEQPGDGEGADIGASTGAPGTDDEAAKAARRRRRGRRGGRRRRGRGGQGTEFEGQQPLVAHDQDGEPHEHTGSLTPQPAHADSDAEPDDGTGRGRRRRRRGRRDRSGPGPSFAERDGAGTNGGDFEGAREAEPGWSPEPRLEAPVGESSAEQPMPAAFPARDAIIVENNDAASGRAVVPEETVPRTTTPEAHHDEPRQSEGTSPHSPEPTPSGPPRRGWWQRVLTGR